MVSLSCELCKMLGKDLDGGSFEGFFVVCTPSLECVFILLFSDGRFQSPCCVTLALLKKISLSCLSGLVSDGN